MRRWEVIEVYVKETRRESVEWINLAEKGAIMNLAFNIWPT
jgi:hypothetical protein